MSTQPFPPPPQGYKPRVIQREVYILMEDTTCNTFSSEQPTVAVRPLPWWVWTTTRWGGSTTGAPFWRLVHFVNIATQIRGWWLKLRGY